MCIRDRGCLVAQQLRDPPLSRGKCKDYFDASAFLSASMADCLLHSIRSASEVAFSRQACRSGDSPVLLQAAMSPVSNRRGRMAFISGEQGCSCASQGSTKKHQKLPTHCSEAGSVEAGGSLALPRLGSRRHNSNVSLTLWLLSA